ncbi:MAG: XkdQ/YqbQ family protein [Desulfotomaculales bacterium]
MSYIVTNVLADGTAYDISQLIGSIKWGGDIRQAARHLEVSLAFGRDYYLPRYDAPLGSLLVLRSDNGELLRGVIFDRRKDTAGGYSLVAYDHLIYLLKSKGTYIFREMTATAIIQKLCSDFGIPVGEIANTGITLDKLILRDQTIYDMCVIALTETTKRNGKKYMMRMKEGALQVIEKAQQPLRWFITEGQNLIEASYSENIEDMRNRIVIVGDKDQVLATVEDTELIKQYGVLQELKREGNIKTGEARTIAANILKDLGKISREASITCLGLDDVEAGTAIEVQESLTGLVGTFYVDTDEHTVENGQHIMSLKLNWTDEVATKEAPEVTE